MLTASSTAMYSQLYTYDQACGYGSLPQIAYEYPGPFEQRQSPPSQVAPAVGPMKRGKRRRISEDEPCLVCGGKATAYHYGVASCHSCKAFFRRSILSGLLFTCQYNGNCEITPHDRCFCRRCRLDRCFQAGMTVEALGGERDRRSSTVGWMPKAEQKASQAPAKLSIRAAEPVRKPLAAVDRLCDQLRSKPFPEARSLKEALAQPSFLFRLDELEVDGDVHFEEPRPATNEDVQKWNARETRVFVEWAKALNGFQKLAEADQVSLLKHSALSMTTLNVVCRSLDEPEDRVIYPDGTFVTREMQGSLSLPGCHWTFGRQIDEIVCPLKALSVGTEDIAALKTTLFFNPDAPGLSAPAKSFVSAERQKHTWTLFQSLRSKNDFEVAVEKFSSLLLLAAPLRSVDKLEEENIGVMSVFEHLGPVDEFVKELCLKDC